MPAHAGFGEGEYAMRMTLANCVVAVAVCASASAVLAAPAAVDIPEDALKASLSGQYVKLISDWTDFYSKQMLESKDEAGVVAARTKLIGPDGYGKYDSPEFRFVYAREACKSLTGANVLDAKDTLKNIRVVNAALCVSRMPQPSIQATLDKMVVHANPAVRYFGWQGYRQIRAGLMNLNKEAIGKMFKPLSEQLPKEASPVVVEAMLAAANLATVDVTAVSEDVRKFASAESYAIYMKNWPTFCQAAIDGSGPMALACREGVQALKHFGNSFGADKAKMAAIQQAVADAMWCAGNSYDAARKLAAASDGLTKMAAEETADADAVLLRDCEDILNALAVLANPSAKRNNFVTAPLQDPKEKDGAAVLLGVVKWVEALKPNGVNQPAYKVQVAAAEPASVPASATADSTPPAQVPAATQPK